jgi:uridine kinase
MALHDIKESLEKVSKNSIEPSIFMARSNTGKPFADLSKALNRASKLVEHLEKIPKCDPSRVPQDSILLEFIGKD